MRLEIELPKGTSDINIEIFQEGISKKIAKVSLASQDKYSIKLSGAGTQTVKVTLNGSEYRDYKVNFKKGTYEMTKQYELPWADKL